MSLLFNPAFILTTAFMAFVMQMIRNYWFSVPLLTDGTSTETETETAIARNLNVLQSHPMCGLTSEGREECWWGCDRKLIRPGMFLLFTVRYAFKKNHI